MEEFIIIIGGILVLFIYITRLATNEIFSPSNKIHREVGRAKDLSAPRYVVKENNRWTEVQIQKAKKEPTKILCRSVVGAFSVQL